MSERHELENKLRGESLVRKGLMKSHAHIKQVRIVNGHQRGNIIKALNGEAVGTIIRA